MKKIFILSFALSLSMMACKDKEQILEEPGSKLEGIHATWEMVEVVQVDEVSISKDELDVSDAFIAGTPMQITMDSENFTYSVTNTAGPNFFGDSGSWEFDDNEFPTKITITSNTSDVIELPLESTTRPQDAYFHFKHFRKCGGSAEAYIAYKFKFIRVN